MTELAAVSPLEEDEPLDDEPLDDEPLDSPDSADSPEPLELDARSPPDEVVADDVSGLAAEDVAEVSPALASVAAFVSDALLAPERVLVALDFVVLDFVAADLAAADFAAAAAFDVLAALATRRCSAAASTGS